MEDLLPDIGRQVQKVRDLCLPGPGDVGQAGQFGAVGDLTAPSVITFLPRLALRK